MLGQCVSLEGKKYNVIILAGGEGLRMGEQSEYIPKALSQIGKKRAIDYILERHLNVAHKFILGTCKHADILESYVTGRFFPLTVEFSREDKLINNAVSLMYCLDHADTRYGTIITFCDLLTVGNPITKDDSVLVATGETKGIIGTFRHLATPLTSTETRLSHTISMASMPTSQEDFKGHKGILGYFVLGDTKYLKSIVYSTFRPKDLTSDFIWEYNLHRPLKFIDAKTVYEFGTENDLEKVRKVWEDA